MDNNEIKKLIEDSNKLVEAIRGEVKSNDVLFDEKMKKMEADLATRLTAIEEANRPVFAAKSGDKAEIEHKNAFISAIRQPMATDLLMKSNSLATKSVNIATGSAGGYAVPKLIADNVMAVALDKSPIRQLATVVTVGSSDFRQILDNSNAGYEWLGDADTRNVTTSPTFSEIIPTFGEIAADVEVTAGALEDMFFPVESWITTSLANKFAAAEGEAFITGNGTSKPTGILNGSVVSTSKTGHASTLGTNPYDALIDLVYGVKAAYRTNGSFIMNSSTLAQFVKVKDSTNNYIYQPSIAQGVAQTLLGYKVYGDENVASVAVNAKVAVFGDFKEGYLIADRVGFTMLYNPYGRSGYVKFVARKKVGGNVANAAALKALIVSA